MKKLLLLMLACGLILTGINCKSGDKKQKAESQVGSEQKAGGEGEIAASNYEDVYEPSTVDTDENAWEESQDEDDDVDEDEGGDEEEDAQY